MFLLNDLRGRGVRALATGRTIASTAATVVLPASVLPAAVPRAAYTTEPHLVCMSGYEIPDATRSEKPFRMRAEISAC